jgi:hypothetical protein
VHAPPGLLAGGFASAQAAWRFYGNERVKLPELAEPLLIHARQAVADCCDQRLLVVMDWSNLHYGNHDSKLDRVGLSSRRCSSSTRKPIRSLITGHGRRPNANF